MRFYQDKVCIITGASQGIGAALALELARRGGKLALFARSAPDLEEIRQKILGVGGEAIAISGDVTKDEDVARLVRETLLAYGGIDVVIANAGVGMQGLVADLSLEDIRGAMEVNFFGAVRTIKATLEHLRARGDSRLAVTSSVAGKLGIPVSAAYSASKFALQGFCSALRAEELYTGGPKVTLVCPGFVESEIQKRATYRGAVPPEMPPSFLVMPVEKAARQFADAVEEGAPEAVLTFHGKAVVQLNRFAPRLASVLTGEFVRRMRKSLPTRS